MNMILGAICHENVLRGQFVIIMILGIICHQNDFRGNLS